MLVFIHGMWGSPKQWINYVKYFEKMGFEVEAVDYSSKINTRNTGAMKLIKEVEKYAEGNILVGHSFGGLIVQKLAERKNIAAGIAISSAPPHDVKFSSMLTLDTIKYLPSVLLNKPFKPDFKFLKKYILNCVDDERAKEIYSHLNSFPAKASMDIFMRKIRVDERKINSPLLFIAGKRDIISPPEMVRKIAEKYNAEYDEVDICHWIFDNYDEIAKKIEEFIKENNLE
ncbi:MAG: alpha/beta hydrolase [Thermoplasmata archaeon]|nr:alpha/beta hydrolase [Thermoplasmata archaeon]